MMRIRFTAILGFLLIFGALPVIAQSPNETLNSNNKELNVTVEFWNSQRVKARAKRTSPVGERPRGLNPRAELLGGPRLQVRKMKEMVEGGYRIPLDFADLAEKLLAGELVELPSATEDYVIEVGGSANSDEFTEFTFDKGSVALESDSAKYLLLKKLADDFAGVKYDLSKPMDRKQMRIRLLRTLQPAAKTALDEVAAAYRKKYNRPLIVSSMTRSIEYQTALNRIDSNSFVVRGPESTPPHTSGLSFDLGRKHMTAGEQNFLMMKIVEMEKAGRIDAMIEYGTNAVFHLFVFADGKPPKDEEK